MSIQIPRVENDLRKAITDLEALVDLLHKKAPNLKGDLEALTDATGLVFAALEALERARVYGEEMPLVTPEVDPRRNIFRYGEEKA